MNKLKKTLFFLFVSSLLIFFSMLAFLWWNHFPPLPEKFSPNIVCINEKAVFPIPKYLKMASYNIHFGIGLKWNRQEALKKEDFEKRLNKISEILKEINADIVFLQEIDFNSARSKNIDQANYLAEKAGYSYIAKAPYLRERFHPNLQGLHGCINFGLCILSRFPIKDHEVRIFPHPDEMPFYLKWLYNPHGAQKAIAKVGDNEITLINVHLEPWAQKTREKESMEIASWINKIKGPLILGGDFNAMPPETPNKKGHYLSDAPWFIDRSKWDIENEKTIRIIRSIEGITDGIPPKTFLKNQKAAFTYPSDSPKEMIDYIFARYNAKVMYGYIFHRAKTASDHLPIVSYIKYLISSDINKISDTTYPAKTPPISKKIISQ